MTKILSMESHINYNLNAIEGFVIFLTFKLITCFIDNFNLKMKSQSIAYLLNGSKHIDWILTLRVKCTQYGICGYISDLQEFKGNGFFRSQAGGQKFYVGSRKYGSLSRQLPLPKSTSPKKFRGGVFNVCPLWWGLQIKTCTSCLSTISDQIRGLYLRRHM